MATARRSSTRWRRPISDVAGSFGWRLDYAGFGGWDTGRHGLDYDLIEAIKKGHVALVHAFLAKGASANAQDRRGAPALLWAIGSGHPDCVWLLLDSGTDANARDAEGSSALALARRKKQGGFSGNFVGRGSFGLKRSGLRNRGPGERKR